MLTFPLPQVCHASTGTNIEDNSKMDLEHKRTNRFLFVQFGRIRFFDRLILQNRSTELSTRGVDNLGIIVENSKFITQSVLTNYIR